MTSEPIVRSERGRLIWIGLATLLALGGVLAVGLYAGGGNLRRPVRDPDQPADVSDEVWTLHKEYQSLPEKKEIDNLRESQTAWRRKRALPLFDPPVFDRLLAFSKHRHPIVRSHAFVLLSMFGSSSSREPLASDKASQDQSKIVYELMQEGLHDPFPNVRGYSLRFLGFKGDGRFVQRAREVLTSEFEEERKGAEDYFWLLERHNSKSK